jgi:hypothetical protein
MNSLLLEELQKLRDTQFHSCTENIAFDKLKHDCELVLPKDHEEVLRWSNGVEAYAGYVRLFGIHTTESIDAVMWNEYEFWKFAWGNRCSEYWCFGETPWGDQYAYSYRSLQGGSAPEVYFLDAVAMRPEIIASSFAEFFEREFLRSAKEPYDVMIKKARQKLGALDISSHLVYVPSLLLGGREEINNVQKMNARSAMICNGDIALQLAAGPDEGTVQAIQSYEDELHRTRLQLVWAQHRAGEFFP